jgi:hypothetical protein
MLDFNTEPYNDDYNEDSKFYRILFRPSFAVQARELTQLQTILQNQISRHGGAIYKQGAMVIPGQVSIDTNAQYVKLTASYTNTTTNITTTTESFIQSTVGKYITGSTSKLQAQIIKVVSADTSNPTTIYVRYRSSDAATGTQKTFTDGEVITFDDGTGTIQAASSSATGTGSLATVQRGVYYVNGFFVLCADPHTGQEQTIVLDRYTNNPSYRVGLLINESKLTPEEDSTLLDNAQTSYNYAAPGAHRYHIDLILTKLPINSVDDQNFIELLKVNSGTIVRIVNKTEYSELEKTLARRTYDEAGNYTVRPFNIDVREARNNNRGAWVGSPPTAYVYGDIVTNAGKFYTARNTGTSQNTTPPTHTTLTPVTDGGIKWEYTPYPVYNRGISLTGSDDQLAIALDPGKAYVQGYELEKVATEYVYVNKCRDSSHQVQVTGAFQPTIVGNYILVNSVNSAPFVNTFPTVGLYNRFTTTGAASAAPGTGVGTQVGTARVRFIEWDNGTIGTTGAQYKLGLFDIQMYSGYDFKRNVKSLYYNNPATGATGDFSADILPIATRLVGAATASSSTTITGTGTSFQTDLVVGDYVSLGGTYRRVVTITNQNTIVVDQATTVTGVTIDRVSTQIVEPENETMLFRLPYYAIKSLTAADGVTNKTNYTVYQRFDNISPSTDGSNSTLSFNATSGVFAPYQSSNYIFVDTTTGVQVAPISSTGAGTGSATFTFSGLSYVGHTFIAICTIIKTLAANAQKTKTLQYGTRTFTTAGAAQATVLNLLNCDGYRVTSVLMDAGSFSAPTGNYTLDISDHYNFNDGQTTSYYGPCKLELKPSYTVPSGPVQVTYEYFSHNGGDYCSVDSYPWKTNGTIDYKKIPFFGGISLRDCIDFRPRMLDDGSGGFDATSTNLVPKRGYELSTDYSYYVGRTDKLAIDSNGQFFAVSGTPSINPGDPPDPKQGMVLYTLNYEPYTFSTTASSVAVTKVENKRYTMRDIGTLEQRINNLEYYTSLSLLEQQTEALTITDSTTGLNRFKNGFVVDNFSGHNTGDATSVDYYCSIDMNANELRPFYSMKNVNLIEKLSDDISRASSNYKLTGDLITLPYTTTALITQPYASRIENINPFAIFTFLGQVNLNPPSDVWFETDRRPDIVQNKEGDFNTIATLAEKAGVLGTVWNAWQTQWTGEPVTATQTFVGDQRGLGTIGWRDGLAANTPADQLNAMFGDVQGQGWAHRVVTQDTTAVTSGLTRTGINTQVVSKIDTQLVEDRILSTAVIPYIRSRNILIQATGLKPNTTFYPFFDNVSVSSYCTPATKITYTPGTIQFDTTSNVGLNTTQTARLINGDSQTALSTGDVITGRLSGATAVVVGTEQVFDSTGTLQTSNLYVVNIKGTFQTGEGIDGSISLATGTGITVETVQTAGGTLGTDVNGKVQFLFNIPNSSIVRFRTGQRQFTLSDSSSNDATYTSRGNGQYFAQGVLETKQATYTSTRNGILVQNQVDPQFKTITQTTSRVVSDTGWYDPLAQTFMIDSRGGAFLTSVDLFFATKDINIPVHIEIREVVNGVPGKTILPFSQVALNPEKVNISTNLVTLPDGTKVPDYNSPTTFTFSSPVYVNDKTEYALIVASDSNGYKAWISNMGDTMPGSSRTISEQPYAGVLFKSQNGSTWSANQDQDLKFTINRAVFATNTQANVQFVNDIVPKVTLDKDPFETNSGSTYVRVYHRNHGLTSGTNSYVSLYNSDLSKVYGVAPTSGTITCNTGSTTVTGSSTVFNTDIGTTTVGQGAVLFTNETTPRYIGVVASVSGQTSLTLVSNAAITLSSATGFTIAASINGIPVTEIYNINSNLKLITAVTDNDSYVITTTTTGKKFGYAGGQTVTATGNVVFNAIQPQATLQSFSDSTATFYVGTTSAKSTNGSETPYNNDATPATGVVINDTNYFSTPRMIASPTNESSVLSNTKSFTLQCKMSTSNNAVSPVLDTKRMGLIAISNTLNSPSETNINYGSLDQITLTTGNTNIGFSSSGITGTTNTLSGVAISGTSGQFTCSNANIAVGDSITITGTFGGTGTITSYTTGTVYKVSAVTGTAPSVTGFTLTTSAGAGIVTTTGTPTGLTYTADGASTKALLSTLQVGKYITISGAGTSTNNGTYLITGVASDGSSVTINNANGWTTASAGTAITIVYRNGYIDEISPLGSSTHSKYVTKKISLATPATSLKIRVSINSPTASNVAVYYKTSPVGTKNAYGTINYTLANQDGVFPKVQFGDNTFKDVDYTINGLTAFDAFTVKIVYTSTNTSEAPRAKDLRIIATS